MLGLGLDLAYKYSMSMTEEYGLLNSLIAYWKLDETSGTRYDSHGSYDLIEYGSGEIESGGGVIGNSAIQNDLNEGVSLYIEPSPYDSVNSSWSFSFWMSTNDNGDDTNQVFPNAWANCCLFRIRTLNDNAYQTVEGTFWHDPTDVNEPTSTDVSKSGVYGGGFVHVAVTHDLATKTVRVYYNGVEEHVLVYNTTLCGVSPLNGFENTILSMFAGDVSGTNYPGPAKIDEIGIWGRALEADEVYALYGNGDGLMYEDFASVTLGDPNAWDVTGLNLQIGLYTKQYWGYFNDNDSFFDDKPITQMSFSDIGSYFQITDIGNTDLINDWNEMGFNASPEYDTPESIGQPFPAVGKGVYYFGSGGSPPVDPARVGPALKSEEVASVVYGNYSAVPNNESLIIRGYFKPTVSGLYTFKLASDDASYLWLGPNAFDANRTMSNYIVGLPGLHGVQENTSTFSMIGGLYYPLTIEFGNGPEGAGVLLFEYLSPGSSVYSSVLTGKIAYNPVTKGH